MRILSFAIVTLLTLTVGAGISSAQRVKGKKATAAEEKPEASKNINDVGGKTLADLVEDISSPDRSKGVAALKSILMFGPERARVAVPHILKMLEKHTKFRTAIDPSFLVNAPTTLTMILTNQKPPTTDAGKKKLFLEVKETIAVLKVLVHDSQVVVRHRAAQALAMFGPYAKDAIPSLKTMLTPSLNPSFECRQAVIVALASVAQPGKGKEPDPKVMSALYARLKDNSSPVRSAAISALQALGADKLHSQQRLFETAVEALAQKKSEEPLVRIQAHLALYKLNTKVTKDKRRAAIASFLDPTKYRETAVRLQAAQALGAIGEDAMDQLRPLVEAVNDKEGNVGQMAILSIANIGRKDKNAKSFLARMIKNQPKLGIRLEVLKAIGNLGPDAADVLDKLQAATQDKDEKIAATAILAVASVGRKDQAAKQFLGQIILKGPKPDLRLEAIRAVGNVGEDASDLVPVLRQTAQDMDEKVKATSFHALASVGRKDPLAKKFLGERILTEAKPEFRMEAIKAVGSVGEDAADLIPTLLNAAQKDKEDDVKVLAIVAITNMGPPAMQATPALQQIVGNLMEPQAVRDAAQQAIRAIRNIKPATTSTGSSTKGSSKKGASR